MNDLLLNDSYDLLLDANNNLVRGESTEQHQNLLLITNKGDWRFSPLMGVGIRQYVKDDDNGKLLGEIKEQFEKDGMSVKLLQKKEDKIIIDATYRNN